MTYQEFKNKYNGKYIDYDGAFSAQCWDLIQYYNVEVLNVPDSVFSGCGWVGNMVLWDWKYAELMKYFDEVSTIDMQPGDVCIWADPNNEKNCHVAVYDHYNSSDNNCYYFSQNPNPCKVMVVNMKGHHCFRRKKETPPAPPKPTPVITPNVERDEYKNQIEVLVDKLRIRTSPSLNGEIIGTANPGFYNYFETKVDEYVWYRISDNNWIASSDEWTKVYPAKPKDEYVNIPPTLESRNIYFKDDKKQFAALNPKEVDGLSYKILSKDGEYAEIEIGKVYVKITDKTPITNEPTYKRGN